MSSVSGSSTRFSHRDGLPSINWRSWPLVDDVRRTAIVVIGLIAAWTIVRWTTGQAILAVITLVVLAASLWRFFLPVRYELNVDGVEQRCVGYRSLIPWRSIKRYEIRPAGVLLFPRADRCPMDSFRALYLPWCNHRDEVLMQVEAYLEEEGKEKDEG